MRSGHPVEPTMSIRPREVVDAEVVMGDGRFGNQPSRVP
jgi:hypothetical protein